MASSTPVRLLKQPANGITIKLDRPLSQLHWSEQSLLFCELSRLSYFPQELVQPIFEEAGITDCQFIDREGAQAYILGNKSDLMIVCRGTEPHDWNDLRADANAMTVLFDVGRLHLGFKSEVDELWPIIERVIRENQRPIWFAGLGYRHSGFELYCDHQNRLRTVYALQRSLNRFKGLWAGLWRGSIDYLSDHSNLEYITIIRGLLVDFRAGKHLIELRVRIDE